MSVEFAEAHLLAQQMNRELTSKKVAACKLANCTKFQTLGFISPYLSDFERLCNQTIETVISKGNVIRVKFSDAQNLLIAPEYGGIILFHKKDGSIPEKFRSCLKLVYKRNSGYYHED